MTRLVASFEGFLVGLLLGVVLGAATGGTGTVIRSASWARGPEPADAPRTSLPLRGIATWYDHRRGHAAAGPELRRALGAGWRGSTVVVSANGRRVVVALTDWCACPNGRVVDLDRRDFAVLAPPSRGVLRVTVTSLPSPPETSTEP